MGKKLIAVGVGAAAVCAGLVWMAQGFNAPSEEVPRVHVTNFPPVQPVQGTVSVGAPIPHGMLVRRENIAVPPIKRSEITNLVNAGTIDTEGFTSAVLSLQGEMKAQYWEAGTVGAMLVPEEGPVVRAMRDGQRIQFPMEVSTRVETGDSTFFNSGQVRLDVGFSHYRVYFYNSTNKGAEANLYVYLCN